MHHDMAAVYSWPCLVGILYGTLTVTGLRLERDQVAHHRIGTDVL